MQLPYQSNHYKNSNPFYIRFIQYINQKYNQSFEIDVVDKKLPELIDKNHFEIIKNHKEHSFNIRESEEYFVFWMIELIKEYHLDSKMCTNDEIYNIIKNRQFNIFDISFLWSYYSTCCTKIEARNITYNVLKILNLYSNLKDNQQYPILSEQEITKNPKYFDSIYEFYAYDWRPRLDMWLIVDNPRIRHTLIHHLDNEFSLNEKYLKVLKEQWKNQK